MTNPTLNVGDRVTINTDDERPRRNGTLTRIERRPFGLDYLVHIDTDQAGTWHTEDEIHKSD